MKSDDCKIIQDLLPNYIDKLTNEYTNEFIEKHLSECQECKASYDEMSKQVDLGFKVNNVEVSFMKKIHKKIKIMGIVIFILALLLAIAFYINYKASYLLNEDTNKIYGSDIQISEDRYLYIQYNSNYNDIDIDTTILITLDNNDICKNVRIIEKSNNEKAQEEIKTKYNMIKGKGNIYSNIELKENQLSYNYNKWNGTDKNSVINELKEYKLNIIEY